MQGRCVGAPHHRARRPSGAVCGSSTQKPGARGGRQIQRCGPGPRPVPWRKLSSAPFQPPDSQADEKEATGKRTNHTPSFRVSGCPAAPRRQTRPERGPGGASACAHSPVKHASQPAAARTPPPAATRTPWRTRRCPAAARLPLPVLRAAESRGGSCGPHFGTRPQGTGVARGPRRQGHPGWHTHKAGRSPARPASPSHALQPSG